MAFGKVLMKKLLKIYYCVLLPVAVTLCCLAMGAVRFIVNDDIAMMRMAESYATNAHSEQLVFISVIYGYLLRFLYLLFGGINWFLWLELAVLNIAFVSLFYLLKKYNAPLLMYALFTAAEVFILYNLTFTSISFICITAAIVWPLCNVEKLTKKSIKHLLYAFVLMMLAFCMRSVNTYYFTLIIFLPLYAFSVINRRNRLSVIAVVIALCTIANYSVVFTQNHYNAALPEELYFNEFQEYRSDANDGGLYDYSRHKEELDHAGISANDFELLSHWVYADKEAFSAETMKAIATTRSFDEKYNTNILQILVDYFDGITHVALAVILLILTLLLLILSKKERLEALAVFAFTIGTTLLLYILRRPMERVINPIIIIGIILVCLLLVMADDKRRIPLPRGFEHNKIVKQGIMILLSIAILAGTVYYNQYTYNDTIKTRAEAVTPVTQYIEESPDKMFLADSYWFDKYKIDYVNQHMMMPYSMADSKIYTLLGGWTVYSYYYYDNLQNLELDAYQDSVISALLEDDVYFVTKYFDPDVFVTFFEEHYDIAVTYEVVKEFDDQDITIYHFIKA